MIFIACRQPAERTERSTLLEQGQLDLLDDLTPDERENLTGLPGIELRSVADHSVNFIGLRVDRPPLDDPRIRRAIAFGMDRSKLASEGRDVATQLVNSRVFGCVTGVSFPGYSRERPRRR